MRAPTHRFESKVIALPASRIFRIDVYSIIGCVREPGNYPSMSGIFIGIVCVQRV